MRRNLILLDLLLAALIGVAGWRLRVQYLETLQQQNAFFAARVTKPAPPAVMIPATLDQLAAIRYERVASQLALSKDRNPTVIVDVVPPKPRPPYPHYYGMMNLGAGTRVILAAGGSQQKSYVVGDTVGEYKLVEITAKGLEFEWDGKRWKPTYEEIRDTSGGEAAPTTATAQPSQVKQASAVTTVSSANAGHPGVESTPTTRSCQPGDASPAGTVSDGYRKVLANSPFGKSCYWEKIN